jgi:hypothetical protein
LQIIWYSHIRIGKISAGDRAAMDSPPLINEACGQPSSTKDTVLLGAASMPQVIFFVYRIKVC